MTHEALRKQYLAKHKTLVRPRQGWTSLHSKLWLAYSMVAKRGYYDVGTYANKPGDHSWGNRNGAPGLALAFDMRRKSWVSRLGWGFRNARKTAEWLWENHVALNIDYVIVGRQIISRSKPYWHPLTTGDTSHDWHIHVSGYVK